MSVTGKQTQSSKRRGFTLVELVVVVLIVGIMAAVAAPRMFNTADNARDSSTRQSLTVVRDAIQMYFAQNEEYPPAATLATALEPYLNGPFPTCQTGNVSAAVRAAASEVALAPDGNDGWAYHEASGRFVVNHADGSDW